MDINEAANEIEKAFRGQRWFQSVGVRTDNTLVVYKAIHRSNDKLLTQLKKDGNYKGFPVTIEYMGRVVARPAFPKDR